jgi:hypothetical protein
MAPVCEQTDQLNKNLKRDSNTYKNLVYNEVASQINGNKMGY